MSLAKDSEDLPVEIDLVVLKEQLSKNGIVVCPVHGCDQDFKSLWGLKYHLKQTNHQTTSERKFKCLQCNLMFQSRVNLRQHRIKEHSDSESGSPLSSPSSKDKGLFHFASPVSSPKQETIQTADNSRDISSKGVNSELDLLAGEPELNKSSQVNSDFSAESNNSRNTKLEETHGVCDGNVKPKLTGSTKQKKVRPRKTPETPHANKITSSSSASKNSHLPSNGSPDEKVSDPTYTKTPPDAAVSRRTSTRVRTPRNFYIYEDSTRSESPRTTARKRGLKRNANDGEERGEESDVSASKKKTLKTPKKRGRKPKKVAAEKDVNLDKTPRKKRRMKRQRVIEDNAVNSCDIGDDKENDDENCDVNEENVDGSNDGDDDRGNDDDSDGSHEGDEEDESKSSQKPRKKKTISKKASKQGDESVAVPKKKSRRQKRSAPLEATKLKRLVNAGRKLTCKNRGCGARFTTALGYMDHGKICGVKEEDREKFICEMCGKEYLSMPGLSYHLKAKHTESEPVENGHSDDNNEEAQEPEVTQAGRARRKAASRALSKVQQLVADHGREEAKVLETDEAKRKDKLKKRELDQMLSSYHGRDISKEQEDKWSETLKTGMNISCPCKGCSETFTSVSSVKEHLSSCEKAISYKCLACNRTFAIRRFARKHVKFCHVGYMVTKLVFSPRLPAGMDNSDTSDVDFKAISSGDSEQESDEEEDEEIKDSGSNVDEEFDKAEVFVWDDKKKRYKKPRLWTTDDPKVVKLGHVGERGSPAYEEAERWRKQVHKHKELFPGLKPSVSHWSAVDIGEIKQYLPEAAVSPQFTIRRTGKDSGSHLDTQLPLFGSTSKDDSCVYGDVTFNVGGPVWAMDWCPVPDSRRDVEQFLAISTHKSFDQVHSIHKTSSSKGLIQLWNVGQLTVDSASSGSKPALSLGIAHNYGAVWDISWCPSGTWEPESSRKNEKDGLSRLGLMAVACSDGLVRVLSVPWPSQLFSPSDMEQSDSYSFNSSVIMRATPHAVLVPCALGVAYDGQCGQAWCVKWCPHGMHEKIATGFSDGTVAIWNLLTESVLLKESVGKQTFCLSPFLQIMTNLSVIRDVAWCPHNPDIFATGGYDRNYKLWNLKAPNLPITSLRRGIPTEIHWPASIGNFISCEDDCFQTAKCPSIVRNFCFKGDKFHGTLTAHNSTIWSLSVSDWSRLLTSGDAGGEVEVLYLRRTQLDRRFPKFGVYRASLEKLRPDSVLPRNEQSNQEQNDAAANQNESISEVVNEAEVDISVGKNDASFPRTTREVFQQHKLVFHDVNALEFSNTIDKSDPEAKRLLNPASMQAVPCDRLCNPQAIHKVRFNPNKQAFTWLASGGAAGLARLHLVKQVKST